MTLDYTRPIQTRNGCPARILATDFEGPNSRTLAVAITTKDYGERLGIRFENGHISRHGTDPLDIINVPQKHTRWVNVYPSKHHGPLLGDGYPSRQKADEAASLDRVACIKVEFTEGEGL